MSTYGSGCGVVVVAKKIPCVRNKKDFEEERTALLMTQQNILKNQADRLFHYNCYRSNCYGTEVLASCTKNRFKCLTALVKSSGPRKCALSPRVRKLQLSQHYCHCRSGPLGCLLCAARSPRAAPTTSSCRTTRCRLGLVRPNTVAKH